MKLIDTVEKARRDDDWKYSRDGDEELVSLDVKCKNGSYRCRIITREKQDQAMVLVASPNHVPEPDRLATAEYLTRANYGLRIGSFDFHMSDGQVIYRVGIDVEDGVLSATMVINMVRCAFLMMDKYQPGLMAMLYGDMSPSDAIRSVEGWSRRERALA